MTSSPEGKKRKHEKGVNEAGVVSEEALLAAQAALTPAALDTSKWPLLLKVCLHDQ